METQIEVAANLEASPSIRVFNVSSCSVAAAP